MTPGQRPLPGRTITVEKCHLFGDLPRQMLLHQSKQKILLAAEVPVHRALGEAGLGGDFVERRTGEAAARVDLRGGLQQSLTRLGPALGTIEVSTRHLLDCPDWVGGQPRRAHICIIPLSRYTHSYQYSGMRSRDR